MIQRHVGNPAPPARASAADIREFIEEIIRFWGGSRQYFRLARVTQELLARLLDTWLGMMNNGWRLIDERLDGDAVLLSRLKTSYRDTVSALVRKASRDLGVAEPELYQQHNTRIAWWLRRDLAPRTDIVFIIGGGDAFYTSATHYFRFVGARIVTNLRSLLEVRDWLAANPPANGLPWGDVSIVVHANLEGGMQAPVSPGGERATPRTLRAAIENRTFLTLPDAVVDNATRLIIRGCALGRNQEMLELLRSAFGGGEESPQVYAPVHLQGYAYQTRRRGRRQVTTSAEEFFREFWYVGFPASPAPNPRQLVQMFDTKYPQAGVHWAGMLRTRGATERQTYRVTYARRQSNEAPAAGRRGGAQLDRLVRARFAQAHGWTDIRETSRQTGANGLITITFSYRAGRQQFQGATIADLLPSLGGQRDYRALLSRQDDLMATTRPLEEGSNLTADDFFWTLARVRNPGAATFDYRFTGSRTMLRIQRDLVEPDPSRPGRTRRVRPDISETSQYGRELPANY